MDENMIRAQLQCWHRYQQIVMEEFNARREKRKLVTS